MRLAGTEELNVVRSSEGSGRIMAADALKVKSALAAILCFFYPSSSQFTCLDSYCAVCHHSIRRGDKVARFF